MSQQAQPYPNSASGAPQPSRATAFGLGIAAGILGILSSLWLALVGIGLFVYSQSGNEYGGGRLFVIAGVLGGLLIVLALLMFVLGILAIVKNRQRGVKLLAALLAAAVVSVVGAVIAGALGYTGVLFAVLTAIIMLPLIILSLLSVLVARKSAKRPELQS